MVKIEFPLPFKLPVEDGLKIVGAYAIADFNVVFKQKKSKYRFYGDEKDYTCEATSIIMEYYPNKPFKDEADINNIFHYAVVNSVQYLNNFIDALRSVLNDREISNFTITDLPETINIEYKGKNCVYVTNPVKEMGDECEVSEEMIKNALKAMATWDMYPNIEIVEKFYDKAKYHLAKEDFVFSIVELQTSFEAFIRNTYRLILIKKEESIEKIEMAHKIPFRNLIEQNLAKALKTNLNFDVEGSIKNWHDNLYSLRNQIVHSGRLGISGNDAYKAYDSYVEVRNYISNLLVKEGYLSEDGKIDLRLFVKNSRENVDYDLLHKRLVEKGIFPANSPVIKQ